MKCNTCYFSALFHCGHPQRYIQSFIEDCGLYQKRGGEVKMIDETVICSECYQTVNINDVQIFAKGSKYICNECLAKSF